MREAFVVVLAVPFLVGAALAPAEPDRDVVFRFADTEIVESSGLVVADGLVTTVNDSGDSARVFTVDLATGETVGTTTWPAEPEDVEALAPAPDGDVWVGDIGDNSEARETVTVTRVPIGRGDLSASGTSYSLVYGDRAHDAEALLAHPRTGRLFVVTKSVLGGTVYAAPSSLRPGVPNELQRIGDAPGIVTDGAFFPDGQHVLLRSYGRAYVLDFPSLETVAEVDLPPQKQGEGIAVAPDGTVYASSEGVRSPLLRIVLPPSVERVLAAPPATQSPDLPDRPTPSADPNVAPGDPRQPAPPGFQRDPWQWALGGLLFVGALVVLLRALRPPR
ncbi:WD40 repeat domain-containing protein [Nocardioides guangzhouensis]|uniref:WD40 repeat domain-containing protein n=1 Tax=Nocardioides guangzhouensis TaxID=2497878 RepID=A0A4Q4Z2M7_9ACTN|nr:WD40 repeat domain-containing protein [Nocardioides guangzhouensis]RYP81151.1 WD40 repeat domain-containing protein [Nocardioides guangzhouensis]